MANERADCGRSAVFNGRVAEELCLPGGVTAEIVVRSEDSDGRFCLLRDRVPAGWALPPHRHAHESETIVVAAGRLWMRVDGDERVLGPGDSVHVPANVLHEGATETGAERVVVFSPAGMERFFEALAEDPGQALALAERYGWRFTGADDSV